MIHDVRVVCRPDVATGFRLAGLRVHVAEDAARAGPLIDGLRAEGVAGLVLIEDRLLDAEASSRPRGLPVVVPFPGPAWRETAADDRVIEILRRAIGYRVKLR